MTYQMTKRKLEHVIEISERLIETDKEEMNEKRLLLTLCHGLETLQHTNGCMLLRSKDDQKQSVTPVNKLLMVISSDKCIGKQS